MNNINKLIAYIAMMLAVICLAPEQLKAMQPPERERGVSLGINGTLNVTTFVQGGQGHFLDYFFGPGYGAGLWVNVPFAKRFSFQGEIEYERFRALDNNWTGGSGTDYLVSQAVAVPLLVQYEFGRKLNKFLNFGPELRFNTKALHRTYHDGGTSYSYYPRQDISPVSVALAVGAGMKVPIAARFDFLWEVRASVDLTSISKTFSYQNNNFRRLNLAIRAGFAYRL